MDREIVTPFDKFETFVSSKIKKEDLEGNSLKQFTPKLWSNSDPNKSRSSSKKAKKQFSIFDTPEFFISRDSDSTPRRSGRIANRKRIDYKEVDMSMPRKLRKRNQRISYSKIGGVLRNGKDRYSIKNLFQNPKTKRTGRKNKKPKNTKTASLNKTNQPTQNSSDSANTPVTKGSLKVFEEMQNEIFEAFKKSYKPQTSLVMSDVFKEIGQIFDLKKAAVSGESQNSTGSFHKVAENFGSSVDAVKNNDQPTVTITQAFEDLTIAEIPNEIHQLGKIEETVGNRFPDGSAGNHNYEIQIDISEKSKTPGQQNYTKELQEMEQLSDSTTIGGSNDNQNPAAMSLLGGVIKVDNGGFYGASEIPNNDHDENSEQEIATHSVAEREQSSEFTNQQKRDCEVIQGSSPTFAEIRSYDMDFVFDDYSNKNVELQHVIVIEASEEIKQSPKPKDLQVSEENIRNHTELKLKRAVVFIEKSCSSKPVQVEDDYNDVNGLNVLQEIPHSKQNETNEASLESGSASDLTIPDVMDGNHNVAGLNLENMNEIIDVDQYCCKDEDDDISTKKKADGKTSIATDKKAIAVSYPSLDKTGFKMPYKNPHLAEKKDIESAEDTYPDDAEKLNDHLSTEKPKETKHRNISFEEKDQQNSDLTILEISDRNQKMVQITLGRIEREPSLDLTILDIPAETDENSVMEIDEETFHSDTANSNDASALETNYHKKEDDHDEITKTDADNFCETLKSQLHYQAIVTKERKESYDLELLEIPEIIQSQSKTDEENDMDIDEKSLQSGIDNNNSNDGFISDTFNDTEQSEHNIMKAFIERDQQEGISDENDNASEMGDEIECDGPGDDSVIDEGFLDDVGNYTASASDEEFVNCSPDIEMLHPQEYHRVYQHEYVEIQQYNISGSAQSSHFSRFGHPIHERTHGYEASRFYAPVHDELPQLHMHIPRNHGIMMVHANTSSEVHNNLEISEYIPSPENTQERKPQLHMSRCAPLVYPYIALQHQNRYHLTNRPSFDSEFQHPSILLPNVHSQWSQLCLQSQIQVGQVCENSCHLQVVSPFNPELKNDHWQIVSSKIPRSLRDNDECRRLHDYSCSMQVLLQHNRLLHQDQDDQRDHQAMLPYQPNQRLHQIDQMYQQSVQQENYRQLYPYNQRFHQELQLSWENAEGMRNNCRVYDVRFGRLDSMNGRIFRTGSMVIQFGEHIKVQVIGDLILNSVYESLAFDAFFNPREHF